MLLNLFHTVYMQLLPYLLNYGTLNHTLLVARAE
jgi:hypothetical protein